MSEFHITEEFIGKHRRIAEAERRLAEESPECGAMHLAMAAFHDAAARILANALRPHADGVSV